MADLICRKTMMRCQTQGMCSPHGGCQHSHSAAPRQPDGVDGPYYGDCLEFEGWAERSGSEAAKLLLPALRQYMHNDGSGLLAGYDLETTQTIIDGLRGEVERLQMQLAACGVVALSNTIESAGKARQMHPDYMSASCSDVAGAVDREIALRTERDQQAQRIGELEGLLRSCLPALSDGGCAALANRIAATLSAGKEGE